MEGMVGSRIAHYQIIRQVGEGGMGVVYEATDERDGKHVAIKVMRAEFTRSREALTRFFNEARATNRVRHPGLVEIFDKQSQQTFSLEKGQAIDIAKDGSAAPVIRPALDAEMAAMAQADQIATSA